jgi:hypothetical protein
VGNKADPDAAVKMPDASIDGAVDAIPDTPGPALGSQANPATSCVALKNAGATSGVFYLKDANNTAFQTYCDQTRNGGGWALVYRSISSTLGTTTAFWAIPYAQRLAQKGDPAVGFNYYGGAVYHFGREYMDTFTDVQDKTVIAMVASTTGINETTMKFTSPSLQVGNNEVYSSQFAAGWAASDYDNDGLTSGSCTQFGGGTQHYNGCFVYALAADGETPYDDAGWGPHVKDTELDALQLARQPNAPAGLYSRVKMIERYARW